MTTDQNLPSIYAMRENVSELVMDGVKRVFDAKAITQDKLAQEIRAVSQMAAIDGSYKEAIAGYRLVAEVKQLITKSGDIPPPSGGVHQHQHVHMASDRIDRSSDEDLQAQLNSTNALIDGFKEAELVDDVDLS